MSEKFTINIIGNICSGKSTLIEKVKAQTNDVSFFSIDEYRKRYSDGSAHYDALCWERMIENVAKSEIAIVESSGVSKYFNNLCTIPDRNVITILLEIDTYSSLMRYKSRPSNGLGIEIA
jgi:nicotinamide riboside kinase